MTENLIERVLLLGIGAASLTKEKINELVDELVKKGQLTKEEGQKLIDKATRRAKGEGTTIAEKAADAYQDTLRAMGIATREHVDELERRIAVLEAKVYGKQARVEEPQRGFVVTPTEEEEPS
jgi:polyhydroxyalkanoate synthesis regulator phasin